MRLITGRLSTVPMCSAARTGSEVGLGRRICPGRSGGNDLWIESRILDVSINRVQQVVHFRSAAGNNFLQIARRRPLCR